MITTRKKVAVLITDAFDNVIVLFISIVTATVIVIVTNPSSYCCNIIVLMIVIPSSNTIIPSCASRFGPGLQCLGFWHL